MAGSRVTLTPSGLGGGLVAASNPLEGRWTSGVAGTSGLCGSPVRLEPCPDTPDALDPAPVSQLPEFKPFTYRQGTTCSTFSKFDVLGLSVATIQATREYEIALEFSDGHATGNPSLQGDGFVTTVVDHVSDAIACLETETASQMAGRLPFIHVPPQLAQHVRNTNVDEQGRIRTNYGSVVVISPGYVTNVEEATGLPIVYITGEVWTAYAEVGRQSIVDRSVNTDFGYAEETGIAVFDPCVVLGVPVNYTCPPTSPTSP